MKMSGYFIIIWLCFCMLALWSSLSPQDYWLILVYWEGASLFEWLYENFGFSIGFSQEVFYKILFILIFPLKCTVVVFLLGALAQRLKNLWDRRAKFTLIAHMLFFGVLIGLGWVIYIIKINIH